MSRTENACFSSSFPRTPFRSARFSFSTPPVSMIRIDLARQTSTAASSSTEEKQEKNARDSTSDGASGTKCELPPMDHGWRAWRFVMLAFVLEFVVRPSAFPFFSDFAKDFLCTRFGARQSPLGHFSNSTQLPLPLPSMKFQHPQFRASERPRSR